MRDRSSLLHLAIVVVVVGQSLAFAQDNAADTKRLAEYLKLEPGTVVAEIGAGEGALTVAVARIVGDTGRVYSNELNAARRNDIRVAAEKASLTNVTIIEARPADANLPEMCCHAIFMRNVYHHFADPAAMNQSLWRSLRPGGRIAIIDFPPRNGREAALPTDRDEKNSHGVQAASVERELRTAGFEIVATDEQRGDRWFMVVGQKTDVHLAAPPGVVRQTR